ncbi:MAG: helix-turn-helix domain-containing protein [Verrucomicrobiia bacterium]|jgi:DNA-binding transcriptional regulator YiaG
MCKQASPVEPKTVGEHVRRRRLQLHLFQSDLATVFGVDVVTIGGWEKNSQQPAKRFMPRIVNRLGYDPAV